MGRTIRYVAFRANDDSVEALGRIISDDAAGLWGEQLAEGQWVESRAALEALFDPGYADLIEEQEARSIATGLGFTL